MLHKVFALYQVAWAFARRVHGELCAVEGGWVVWYS